MMRIAKIIALSGLVAMSVVLIYGFTIGDFFAEGSKLVSMPWGIVSLVDLYSGFALFCVWIIYREKSLAASILWTIGMLVLGFWAGSLYFLQALYFSNGDWRKFWLGKNA